MYNFTSNDFKNLGYITSCVPDEVKSSILKEIQEIQLNENFAIDMRDNLVGNLEKEYGLYKSVDVLSKFIIPACEYYINSYDYLDKLEIFSEDLDLIIRDLWVNFQKKGDFNPIHNHVGLFSFVIWVKIPYELNDELSLYKKSSSPAASLFSFHYTNAVGDLEVRELYVDKTWEWKMILFPSKINHSVNPFFTSDEYRISVAGNVFIDVKKFKNK
jgi:hypothetical protein